VGTVEGSRNWGSDIKDVVLRKVEWSDNNKLILFATDDARVMVYDNHGNFIHDLPVPAKDPQDKNTKIIALDWYDGSEGKVEQYAPVLVVGFNSGKIQLMKSNNDDSRNQHFFRFYNNST
jgi:WD repeat-containing protein 35